MDIISADNALGIVGALVAVLIAAVAKWQAKRRNIKRQATYDAIRDDPVAELQRLGWLSHDSRGESGDGRCRADGAPVDYDVSGPSGTLRQED